MENRCSIISDGNAYFFINDEKRIKEKFTYDKNDISAFLKKNVYTVLEPKVDDYIKILKKNLNLIALEVLQKCANTLNDKNKEIFSCPFPDVHTIYEGKEFFQDTFQKLFHLTLGLETTSIENSKRTMAVSDELCPNIFRCKPVKIHGTIYWGPENPFLYSKGGQEIENKQVAHFKYSPESELDAYWHAALAKLNTDVIFFVQDKEITAHKTILQIRSPYFATLFQSSFQESLSGIIEIKENSFDAYVLFLEFIYKGYFKEADKINISTIAELLQLGHLGEDKNLVNWCTDKMNSWIAVQKIEEDFDTILALGITYSIDDFIHACFKYAENSLEGKELLMALITKENIKKMVAIAKEGNYTQIKEALLDKMCDL